MNKKLVSFLLPAYNYQQGNILIVKKLLEGISIFNYRKIEIIVSDNSKNDSLFDELSSVIPSDISFSYMHNKPASTPSENWNSLIDRSNALYYILIHHDEFPYSAKLADKLISLIESKEDIDLIVMDCLVYSNGFARQHVSMGFKNLFLSYMPSFIILKNIIGPTASLVIKKEKSKYFDENIFWLMDVDYYYRILKEAQNILYIDDLKIISNINRSDSLTSSIRSQVDLINKKELVLLKVKYPEIDFFKLKLLKFFFWYPYRFLQRGWQFIFRKKIDFNMPSEMNGFKKNDH